MSAGPVGAPGSAKRLLLRILVSVSLLAVLLESTMRLRYFGLDSFNYAVVDSFVGIRYSDIVQPSSDPERPYELKPNLDTYFKLKRFRTSSQGLRDKEYSIAKPDRVFRIAVVGASYVMGSGVDAEDTFHSVLEDQLNRDRAPARFELMNFGVGGYTADQVLAQVKTKVLSYHPDLLLVGSGAAVYRRGGLTPLRRSFPADYPFFRSYLGLAAGSWLRDRARRGSPAAAERSPSDSFATPELIEHTMAGLASIARTAPAKVCLAFLEHRVDGRRLGSEIASSAGAYGLFFIDASEPFRRQPQVDMCAHPLDCHPSARAHRIFAAAILDALETNDLLPHDERDRAP
ncbi:MAG: SGNH/GDSL hydrolase family protein [Deltaproteobacteria bacterium]|nr:SGNH/GDSL hydrolase family protein [Deltaproteobacteria bacterium]